MPAGTAIFSVPDSLPDVVAAPANCATATVAAIFRHAGSMTGATVAVCGAGMLGLTACAMARVEGAGQVIAIEPAPARRDLALHFGAHHATDPDGAAECIRTRTGGQGVEFAIELSGLPEAHETAVTLLREGGLLLMAGAVFPSRPVALPAETVVRRMLRLSGVYNYLPQDLAQALKFLSRYGLQFPFETLVEGRFPLELINEAVAMAERSRPPRVAILPA